MEAHPIEKEADIRSPVWRAPDGREYIGPDEVEMQALERGIRRVRQQDAAAQDTVQKQAAQTHSQVASPVARLVVRPRAVIVTGLPASGNSTIASMLKDNETVLPIKLDDVLPNLPG
jgi:hypothetical protein